jgi:tRNA dimethylallyltransferase
LSAELIAIFGPTAVGKTQIAIELAQLLSERGMRSVAVSADAIQVYEGMDVLSGKPSAEQLEQLDHRLISFVSAQDEYSVGQYAQAAHAEIDGLIEEGCTPIVVGGTGLYLRAALTDLDLKPAPDPDLRNQIERELAEVGSGELHGRLSAETAGSIHPNDGKRIVRALELEQMGEKPYRDSEQLWSEQLRRPATLFGVIVERELLAQRISDRVDAMLEQGAIGEAESAVEYGVSKTARKALGLKEIAAYSQGDVERDAMAAEVKRRHLAYAKRQMTWMRKLANVELIDRTELSDRQAAERMLTGSALPFA